jgi:hypothetical protein
LGKGYCLGVKKAGLVAVSILLGLAIGGAILAIIVLTPVGAFMHRVFPIEWTANEIVEHTPYGTVINWQLPAGALMMGLMFAAGIYSALKDD